MKNIDLVRLQEECAEVVQVICKIKRFGIGNTEPGDRYNNKEKLIQEIADIQVCVENLKLDETALATCRLLKRAKLERNKSKELL